MNKSTTYRPFVHFRNYPPFALPTISAPGKWRTPQTDPNTFRGMALEELEKSPSSDSVIAHECRFTFARVQE